MPLTAEQRAWAEKKIAEGVPKEQVFEFLAQRMPPLGEYGPSGNLYPGGTGNVPEGYALSDIQGGRNVGRNLAGMAARASLVPAGAVLGGMGGRALGAAVPSAIGRVALSSAGEGAGAFLGALGTQAASGEPLDYGRAGTVGLTQTGLSAAQSAGTYAMGRSTGIKAPAAAAAMGRPGFAARVPQEAPMNLAGEVAETAANVPLSPGRVRLQSMIAAHDEAEKFIDNKKILDAMERAMPRGQNAEAVAARRLLRKDIRRIKAEIAQTSASNKHTDQGQYFPYVPPTRRKGTEGMTYPMTAFETDQLIQESLTSAVKKELEGKVGGTAYKAARARARNLAAQEMYRRLGKGAAEAGEEAHQALLARESVQKTFPTDALDIPTPSAASRVVQAGSDVGTSAPVLAERLKRMDEAFGTSTWAKVQELGFKLQWGPKDQQAANIIADTLNLPRGRTSPGYLKTFFRFLARQGVRAQGKTGAAMRGYAAQAFEQALRSSP